MTILNSYNEDTKRKIEMWKFFFESSFISRTSNQDVTLEAVSKSKSSRRSFLEESLKALDALDGIDGTAYAKAIENFHDDELWREIFFQIIGRRFG